MGAARARNWWLAVALVPLGCGPWVASCDDDASAVAIGDGDAVDGDGDGGALAGDGGRADSGDGDGGGEGDGDGGTGGVVGGTGGAGGDGDGDGDGDLAATGGVPGDGDGDGAGGGLAAHCAQPDSYGAPLPAGVLTAKPVGDQSAHRFLEGPVWLADAAVLLFSDIDIGGSAGQGPPSRIRRLSWPSLTYDTFVERAASNGLAVDSDGAVVACDHGQQSLSAYTYPAGVGSDLALSPPTGGEFNSPNDLAIRSDGTIYFTDPNYQRDGRAGTGAVTGVYRVVPGGDVELVDGTKSQPNGITLSPDEQTLYVASGDGNVYRYAVADDGSVGSGAFFASVGQPDGMVVDCAGNLYVANHGPGNVRVFGAGGADLGTINATAGTTNVAFGGSEHKTLFVTANGALLSIELGVPGLAY